MSEHRQLEPEATARDAALLAAVHQAVNAFTRLPLPLPDVVATPIEA